MSAYEDSCLANDSMAMITHLEQLTAAKYTSNV